VPEPAQQTQGRFVQVAVNLPLDREFTYRLPPHLTARVGNRVRVPFRGRRLTGVVIATLEHADVDESRVRDVELVLDSELLLPPPVLELARRIAATYACSLGQALDAALPGVAKRRGARRMAHLELAIPADLAAQAVLELEDRHQARARVLRAVVEYGGPMPLFEARRRTGTSDSPWRTLVKHGTLRRIWLREELEDLEPSPGERAERHELNPEQQRALDQVLTWVHRGEYRAFLLHGITGSGKTEVYLRILEEVRARGQTAIVLVPEISLTPQTVGRFASRFPDVAVLHSGLTDSERGRQWQRLVRGEAGIAIGARSALFAPVSNLGLIVVDEEHEGSFKQENSPRYHAREMALVRGEIENAVVVLGSATPTIESYGRARRGIYQLLELPDRAGLGTLPRILVEDLRREDKDSRVGGVVLSRTLRIMIRERLGARDQVILFLNRRGFAPVLICPSCGTPIKCRRCEVSMTWHVRRGMLICHYCCEERRRPETCPDCGHAGMHELGAGTERVEKAVKELFPEAVVARMDTDTMAQRGAHERVLGHFRKRHIDILIGTQMIAKGLDFPDVTLVGVISADTGLFLPDFRAAERTFQLLYQVAGRAGRGEKKGTVIFQTLCPDNYAVQAAAKLDYESFVTQELAFRQQMGYPPFSRLVRLLVEGSRPDEAQQTALDLARRLRGLEGVETLGPAPPVLSRLKNRHRVHLLLKCFTQASFRSALDRIRNVETLTTPRLRVTLDVDPTSVL
jgi:primosomal protein N' (replication factor Y)